MRRIEEPSSEPFAWNESTADWTWSQIVAHALRTEGGTASLRQLYELVGAHPRTVGRKHWRARMRQVLEGSPTFVRVGSGVWSLSELHTAEQIAEFQSLRRTRWPLLGPRKASQG